MHQLILDETILLLNNFAMHKIYFYFVLCARGFSIVISERIIFLYTLKRQETKKYPRFVTIRLKWKTGLYKGL